MTPNRKRVVFGLTVLMLGLLAACAAPTEITLPTPQVATSALRQPPTLHPTVTASQPPQAAPSDTPAPTAAPATLPDPAGFTWNLFASGFARPLDMQSVPDGSGRLFVVEQAGVIRIVQDGQTLPDAFLDIRERVGSQGNEQGLLGLAFHPAYVENRTFVVNYTDRNGDTVIARFRASADDPNRADAGSEEALLRVSQPYANHNGGGLAFGPDGYLYIALGDGGSGGDPQGNGQSTDTLLGKLLRIDVPSDGGYLVPPDNPYVNGGGRMEIWAIGLRNPFRFSFDALTGDLYIGDVGQNQWEEIDFLPHGSPGGANFGWNYREGTHEYQGQPPAGLALIDPVFEYGHGPGCSVTGGTVYRGSALPELGGVYLFGDFCSGQVWGLVMNADGTAQARELFRTGANISSFAVDRFGEVYLIDLQGGGIYRLERK